MQLSPVTVAKVRGLIPGPFFIVVLLPSLLEMTSTAKELIPLLRAVSFILAAVWLIVGAVARDASDTDRRAFRCLTAAVLVSGLAAAPGLLGLVDNSIGSTLMVAGFAVSLFLALLAIMRLVSALAFALGLFVAVALGGYAFSAGQPLIGGAIAIVFAIVSVFVMVRRVNAADRQE